MPKVAVVTAIAGGYDQLRPHAPSDAADFYCFTDGTAEAVEGWIMMPLVNGSGDSRFAAKGPKVLTHKYLHGYYWYIWVDGSHEIVSPTFVGEALYNAAHYNIALYRHPFRDDILDEAEASKGMAKYEGQDVISQAERYVAHGHPRHWGLWECGVMVKRVNERQVELMETWHNLIRSGTIQDQISFPVACRIQHVLPGTLDRRHHWFKVHPHVDEVPLVTGHRSQGV